MRHRLDDGESLRGPVLCCLLAVVALSLGPTAEAAVRASIRDAARPGFLMAGALRSLATKVDLSRWPWSNSTAGPASALRVVSAEPSSDEDGEELRRLRASLASTRRRLEDFEASFGPVRATPSAAQPAFELILAQVLDESDPTVGPGGLIVHAGVADGVEPNRPAVSAVTLAAGESDGVGGDDLILAGRAVVGRTGEVGAWTSKIVPVTAAGFRAHVRIIRETPEGPTYGEEGLLEGDGGDRCLLKYVRSTAAVSVGDHVYSHDPSGLIPQPMYFGQIESASLRDGAPHWDIRVKPAADVRRATAVYVLRPRPRELLSTAANGPP